MHKSESVFDDLDTLRQESARLMPPQIKTGRRARSVETFARIPHDRGLRLYGQISAAGWVVLVELDRLILESKGQNPIPFEPKRLFAIGMTRSTIYKALRQLQKAKVVQVKQWGRGGRPSLVTHLWYRIN